VLGVTHVIAGTVVSRTLAEQGAEVLHIDHPTEFEHEIFTVDETVGQRSAWLDLQSPDGNRRGTSSRRAPTCSSTAIAGGRWPTWGSRRSKLAEQRPGIIYCSVRGYGYDGPWANRGGFDMEALCVSGFTEREGTRDRPKFPPTKVMTTSSRATWARLA